MPLAWQIRSFGVSILLLVVASHHLFQNRTQDRSAWGTGCGFGMFSTVDYHGSRFFRCYLETDQGLIAAELRGEFEKASLRSRALPTEYNLTVLAEQVIASTWVLKEEVLPGEGLPGEGLPGHAESAKNEANARITAVAGRSDDLSILGIKVDGVRLELWSIGVDHAHRRIRSRMAAVVQLNVGTTLPNSRGLSNSGGSA